jgi:hypothetical protein
VAYQLTEWKEPFGEAYEHLLAVRDMATGEVERIDVSTDGAPGDTAYGENPQISLDGTRVAFEARSTNLAPNDDNGVTDVFVRILARPPDWAGPQPRHGAARGSQISPGQGVLVDRRRTSARGGRKTWEARGSVM